MHFSDSLAWRDEDVDCIPLRGTTTTEDRKNVQLPLQGAYPLASGYRFAGRSHEIETPTTSCSAVTKSARLIKGMKINVHKAPQAKVSGQLPFLGLIHQGLCFCNLAAICIKNIAQSVSHVSGRRPAKFFAGVRNFRNTVLHVLVACTVVGC